MRIYLDDEHYVTSRRALRQVVDELAAALGRVAEVARKGAEAMREAAKR